MLETRSSPAQYSGGGACFSNPVRVLNIVNPSHSCVYCVTQLCVLRHSSGLLAVLLFARHKVAPLWAAEKLSAVTASRVASLGLMSAIPLTQLLATMFGHTAAMCHESRQEESMIRHVILLWLILLIVGCALEPVVNAQIVYDLPGIRESSAVVADFNHDGVPDLAAVAPCTAYGQCLALLEFYLGDGTGHFASTAFVELGGLATGPAVVADFYGNGNLELIVPGVKKPAPGANWDHGIAIVDSLGSVSWYRLTDGDEVRAVQFADLNDNGKLDMLLSVGGSLVSYRGDGAGNFARIGSYGGDNYRLLLGDFNGDGEIDVATDASTWAGGGINVFLGNGDGTFRIPVFTAADGYIAAADFNHDGKLDLAVGRPVSSYVSVLLGNGDGTFSPQPAYNTGQWHSAAVVAGDFNKDGNADVAVADGCWGGWDRWWPCPTDGAVTILSGNGDGTLQLPTSYSAGGRVETKWHNMFMTSSDLDGNGTTDLIVANQLPSDSFWSCRHQGCHGTLAILLGNGDGTFQSAPVDSHFVTRTSLAGNNNNSTYGDPVTFTATVTSEGPIAPTGTVVFRRAHGTATLVDGVATFTTQSMDTGSVNVTAKYSGDTSQVASTSDSYQQTVNPGATKTAAVSSRNPSAQGQRVAFTATVTSTFAIPKGTVTFSCGNTVLGTAQVGYGRATFRTAALPVGSSTITVTYNPALNRAGGTNFITSSGSIVQVVH